MTATTSEATVLATIEQDFATHLAARFSEPERAELREHFQHRQVAPLRGFCPPRLVEPIRAEACRIMDEHGVIRDLNLQHTDNTPRHMRTVGQPVILEHGPLIHATYFSEAVGEFIADIVGEPVYTCPYPGEHYVISRLGRSGDTHGWHWDDYTYGFVLILEAPDYRDGGFVQTVPHTSWNKQDPDVYGALLGGEVHSYAFEAGDAYIVKTNTVMHRVHPIRGTAQRTIVNTTWASAEDLSRPISHETNDILFGGTTGFGTTTD